MKLKRITGCTPQIYKKPRAPIYTTKNHGNFKSHNEWSGYNLDLVTKFECTQGL